MCNFHMRCAMAVFQTDLYGLDAEDLYPCTFVLGCHGIRFDEERVHLSLCKKFQNAALIPRPGWRPGAVGGCR